MVWPLALLRYGPALAAWTAAGLAAYLAMIRRISADRRAWLLALAFPGLFMNASPCQDPALIAALLGGGCCCWTRGRRWPACSSACWPSSRNSPCWPRC